MEQKVNLTDDNVQIFKDHVSVCPVCGKTFCVQSRSDYIYKIRNKKNKKRYMCSYNCLTEAKELMKGNYYAVH